MTLPHPQYLNHAEEICMKVSEYLEGNRWIDFTNLEVEDLPHESYSGFWCWINGGKAVLATNLASPTCDSTYHLSEKMTDWYNECVKDAERWFASEHLQDLSFDDWYSEARDSEDDAHNGVSLEDWHQYEDSWFSDSYSMVRFKIQFYEPANHHGDKFRLERGLPQHDLLDRPGAPEAPGIVLITLGLAYADAPYMRENSDEDVYEKILTYDEFLEWEPDVTEFFTNTKI